MSENPEAPTPEKKFFETPQARLVRIALVAGIFAFSLIMVVGFGRISSNIGFHLTPVAGILVSAWIAWHWLKEIGKIPPLAARLPLYILAAIVSLVLASNFIFMVLQFMRLAVM